MRLTRSALTLWLLLSMAVQIPFGQARSMAAERPSSGGPLIIENAGQWPDAARFQVWGGGPTLWLAEDALWLSVAAGSQVEGSRFDPVRVPGSRLGERNLEPATLNGVNVRLSFPDANPHPRLEPFDRRDTHVSYFLGNDPAGWRPDVPVWGDVRYIDLYPGVDLVVGTGAVADAALSPAQQGGRPQGSPLPWRLEARAGADLAAVRLRVEGADAVVVDGGALCLSTAAGEVRVPLLAVEGPALGLPKGVNVQRANVQRANVERVNGSAFDVNAPFAAAHANPQSQIQNPQSRGLVYSTFLGGVSGEEGRGIFVNAQGSAYLTGDTISSDFPTTPEAFDGSHNSPSSIKDAFVAKLNPTGSELIYATFLGGRKDDFGNAIAVDSSGFAYVTGETHSSDLPITSGAFDTTYGGGYGDAFVVKLDALGTALIFATYLGGGDNRHAIGTAGYGMAVDIKQQVYVTGVTDSGDFPTTPDAFDPDFSGLSDAFVAKLNPAGSALSYATRLGGDHYDEGYGITVDAAGSAYVTGSTQSANFPTTPGAFDTSYNGGGRTYGGGDAFAAKLDAAGSKLVYATFLSGRGEDMGKAIAADAAGSAYVTGHTSSNDFPTTPAAFDNSFNSGMCWSGPCSDAFVAKLDPTGSETVYATFLGGNVTDFGSAIDLDWAGRAYVTGYTFSWDFPITPDALNGWYSGGTTWGDAFVAKLNPAGNTLVYATFLSGSGDRRDIGGDIAADDVGYAYAVGSTSSSDFPTTPGAFDTTYNGSDAFVVKLLAGPSPTLILSTVWYDLDGDATRDAGEPGLAGVQVCAEPLGHRPIRCAISGQDGSYTIELDTPGTYLVAPTAAPADMQLTTPGFRLPVVVREGEQVWDVDFGYR